MIYENKAVLFGAGGVGLMALEYFGSDNVECFVDNNSQKCGKLLCGKSIVSYETLLKDYANNPSYRIYLTTDTFYLQLAAQLDNDNVTNYTFYRDFIPDYRAVKQLICDKITSDDRIMIVGTTNATELVLRAIEELGYSQNVSCLMDFEENKLVGKDFYGYAVSSISDFSCKDCNKVIVTIPNQLISEWIKSNEENFEEVIYAQQAIAYLSTACLEEKMQYKQIDPEKILSSERMDIIPRYLLMKDIINGDETNDSIKSLYARTILRWNDGQEKLGVFSTKAKNGVAEHISCAKALVENIKANGYNQYNYIPISNGIILDGAHRYAASLALNEKVWIKNVNNYPNPCSFSWYEKNGFSLKDRIDILRGFADIYPVCGLFVVFSPAFEQYDYIINRIKGKMTIVGTIELDFSNNFYAFKNIINEIYSTYEGNSAMVRKIQNLMMMPLKLRVILTSDENFENENLYGWMTQLKLELRDELTFDIPAEEYCTMHGTDSKEEFETLKEVLLSYNNYKQLMSRVNTEYRDDFLKRIGLLKEHCKEHKIPLSDVCVVNGAVMEAMGIRTSDDIDIIVTRKIRTLLNTNSTYEFDNENEIVSAGRMRDEKGNMISDDSIILNYNNYFVFYGCKFMNIDNLKYEKMFSANYREKDKRDVRLIEIFNDYALFFEGTNELKKQMRNRYVEK